MSDVTIGNGSGTYDVSGGQGGTITVGNGNDTVVVTGESSGQTITVGNGSDSLTVDGATGDSIKAGNGTDTVTVSGGSGNTIAVGNGNETVVASGDDADTITVGNGNDTVYLGANDTVTIGKGSDMVVVPSSTPTLSAPASITVLEDNSIGMGILSALSATGFGQEKIYGLTAADKIEVSTAQFANFAAVLADAKQVGQNTVITADPTDTITLENFQLSSLKSNDVVFTSGGSSATVSLTISGLPAGATLSSAADPGGVSYNAATQTWTVAAGALPDLTLNAGEVTTATLTVTATDSATGDSISQAIALTVDPIAPTLTAPASLTVAQGHTVALGISETPHDPRDVVSLTITGIPADATLSAGTRNSDGSWTLTPAQLSGLTLTAGAATVTSLTVTATNTLGITASTSDTIALTITSASMSVAVNGTAQEGQVLTAAVTGANGQSLAYQWQNSADGSHWTSITNATGATYTVEEGDETEQIRVQVTAGGSTATSAATAAVLDAAPTVTTPVITGTAQEGQTLSVSASSGQSDNPVTYAWYSSADGYTTAIATGASYLVQKADEGFAIEAAATVTNDNGVSVSAISAATGAVLDAAPTITTPTIAGTAQAGQTLTASADGGDDSVSYAWYSSADGYTNPIATGATYMVQEGDEGATLEVTATSTNANGVSVSSTSGATGPVLDAAPTVTTPIITGTAQEGQTLTASAAAGESDNAVSYTWYSSADGYKDPIGTGATYAVQEGDEGSTIEVTATATNDNGATASATSSPTATVIDNATISVAVSVAGSGAVQQGQSLIALATIAGDATDLGAQVSYQWQSSSDGGHTWTNVAATAAGTFNGVAGSMYQLTEADEGTIVRAQASFTDDTGQVVSATSTPTVVVADVTPEITVPFSYAADDLSIIKNGTQIYNDTFSQAPPASPTILSSGNPTPIDYLTLGGTWTESGGKAFFSSSGAAPNPAAGGVEDFAELNTNTDPTSSSGLKLSTAFTVGSTFDLAAPTSGSYGMELNDGTPTHGVDQLERLIVARINGNSVVELIQANLTTNTQTVLASQTLTGAQLAGNNQIEFQFTHAANAQTVSGSFELIDNGTVTSTANFTPTASIFTNGVDWTRVDIGAFTNEGVGLNVGPGQAIAAGETLTASAATNDADATINYQWQRSSSSAFTTFTDIGTNSPSYVVQTADAGSFIRMVATTSDLDSGQSATATSQVTGSVHLPSATSDFNVVLQDNLGEDSTSPVSGNVLSNDFGAIPGDPLSVTAVNGSAAGVGAAVVGTYGTLLLNANGSYSYQLADGQANVDGLSFGQMVTDTFTYTATDSFGTTTSSTLNVVINPHNDAPVIVSGETTSTGAVTESPANVPETVHTISGTVAFTDENLLDTHTAGIFVPVAGNYGNMSVVLNTDSTGGNVGTATWTYTVSDASLDPLAQGQTATDTFDVLIADPNGGIAQQPITITLTGSNDTPVVQTPDQNLAFIEDSASVFTASGTSSFTDVDLTDSHTVSASLESATLSSGAALPTGLTATLASALSAMLQNDDSQFVPGQYGWNFSLNDDAIDFLAQGEVLNLTYQIDTTDPFGGVGTQDINVAITGVNEAPTVVPMPPGPPVEEGVFNENFTEEDHKGQLVEQYNSFQNWNVTRGNVDFYNSPGGIEGFVFPGDGPFVDLAGSTYGTLTSKTTYGPGTYELTFKIGGTGREGIYGNSPDGVNVSFGSYSENFMPGDSQIMTVTRQVTLTSSAQLSFADLGLSGNGNIGATLFGVSISQVENVNAEVVDDPTQTTLTTSGTFSFGDVDNLDTHSATVTASPGDYGTLVANVSSDTTGGVGPGTVSWTYQVNESAVHALTAPAVDTFTVNVVDSAGASAQEVITVGLIPEAAAAGPPVANPDAGAVVASGVDPGNTPFAGTPTASGNVLANDTDPNVGDVHSVSAVNGSAADVGQVVEGTYGSVTINADGSWTYTLDDTRAATLALPQNAVATDVFTYTNSNDLGGSSSSTLTISVTGTNDAPVANPDVGSAIEAGVQGNNVPYAGIPTAAGNVLANDTDTNAGDTHTVTAINGSAALVGTPLSGVYGTLTLNADGSYTYTLDPNSPALLQLAPGATATDSWAYTNTDNNGASNSSNLTITVTGTLHAPTLSALAPFIADDDAPTPLTIDASSPQGGTITVTVSGVPTGATLTDHYGNTYTGNSVTLTTDQLPGLTLTAGSAQVGSTVTLAVQAQVTDGVSIADSAVQTLSIPIMTEAPALSVPSLITANGNGSVSFPISAVGDPDDVISVTISGIPADASLSDSAGPLTVVNGSVTLTTAQLAGLSVQAGTTPATLTVTATNAEGSGAATTDTVLLTVKSGDAYLWGSAEYPVQPTTGVHLYAPAMNTNSTEGFGGFFVGTVSSNYVPAGPDTVTDNVVTFDPFMLLENGAPAAVETSTISTFPFRYNVVWPSISTSQAEGIAVYQTEDGSGNSYLNQVFVTRTSADGSLSFSSPTQIEGPLTGLTENPVIVSFRNNSDGTLNSYSVAWDQYNPTAGTYTLNFQIFNPNGTAASPVETPISLTGVTGGVTSLPATLFRAGSGSYALAHPITNANGTESVQISAFSLNGSPTGTPITINPDLSHYAAGAKNAINLEQNPSTHTLVTSALAYAQYSAATGNEYAVGWNEAVTDSNGTHDQVEFAVFKPGSGVVSRTTFQIADSLPQDIKVQVQNDVAVLEFGDNTQTNIYEFSSTGAQLGSVSVATTQAAQNILNFGDGRIGIVYDNLVDSSGTSQIVTDVYDFRTSGVNVNDSALADGVDKYVAGTQFNDTFVGENSVNNTYAYIGNATTGTGPSDSFTGGGGGWNVAIMPDDQSNYAISTSGGTTTLTNIGDALHAGSLALNNVQAIAYDPATDPSGNPGSFTATGDRLEILGPLPNGGEPITIANGATLELNTADSGAVTFAGAAGALQLDQFAGFTGSVAGFGAQDQLDLRDLVYNSNTTTASFSENSGGTAGTLTVTNGGSAASIVLFGNYTTANFALASDGHGGTLVTDPPVTQQTQLAQSHT